MKEKKFKNRIIKIDKKSLVALIADYNSDSRSLHEHAKERLNMLLNDWASALKTSYNVVYSKFISTSATTYFYNNSMSVIFLNNFKEIFSADNSEITYKDGLGRTHNVPIDAMYDSHFLYNDLKYGARETINRLRKSIAGHMSDITRYKTDIRTVEEMFHVDITSADHLKETIVDEAKDMIESFGYSGVAVTNWNDGSVEIEFNAPDGSETFKQRHKDAIRSLCKGYLSYFEYNGGTQSVILNFNNIYAVKPDDDLSEELTALYRNDLTDSDD